MCRAFFVCSLLRLCPTKILLLPSASRLRLWRSCFGPSAGGEAMPLPALLNAVSALSAVFLGHSTAGAAAGGGAAAAGASVAKDAGTVGVAASSSAAAGGAKVRRRAASVALRSLPNPLARPRHCAPPLLFEASAGAMALLTPRPPLTPRRFARRLRVWTVRSAQARWEQQTLLCTSGPQSR